MITKMSTADGIVGRIGLIVAHPDDETLWAGGSLLLNAFRDCFILSLCRGGDPDRAPRFFRVLKELGVEGAIADLDDGPGQFPLPEGLIGQTIMENLPQHAFDKIYTHSPLGEYTRHLRHEETGRAVLNLWLSGGLKANEILLFAYEDGGHSYLPKPIKSAPIQVILPEKIHQKKYGIITEIYNFSADSFEAKTTPLKEAFWQIKTHGEARQWQNKGIIR